MNQLKDQILSLIQSRRGFTQLSAQLDVEIPQMLLQLRNYYADDRAFYDILLQIRNRWSPIFSNIMHVALSNYTIKYLNNLQKLEDLIEYAETISEVSEAKKQQIDDLSDELAMLMDPFANVIKGLKRTSIKPKTSIIKKRRL